MNPRDKFTYPCEEYLQACAKTFMAYYYLSPMTPITEVDYNKISFPIFNGITGDKEDTYSCDLEYDTLTQGLIFNQK